MIFDTDILVWVTRGNERAVALVDAESQRSMSVVSYMELIQGAKDRLDMDHIRKSLQMAGVAVLPLSETIGARAAIHLEEHALATGIDFADAMIAATAIETGQPLCTANRKHYQRIAGLELKVFRP